MKTRDVSLGAVMCAVIVIMLLIASYLNTMRLSALFLSSLLMCIIVSFSGIKTMLICYGASAILVWLFVPDKSVCTAYTVFFGNYGAVKFGIEKLKNLKKEWVVKIICACVYGIILYFLMYLITGTAILKINFALYLSAVIFAFVIGDIALSLLIGSFVSKIPFRK